MLTVSAASKGQRVDRFIALALAELWPEKDAPTRSAVQRWIDEGRISIGGKAIGAAHRLRAGEEVRVVPGQPPLTSAGPDESVEFGILYVDDDLVVIDKPAGLVVHPAKGHATGTLVNGLLARGYFRAGVDLADPLDDEGHLRPGIVHRLDAGTSGVMVVARTPAAREKLKDQFARHSIERVYEAISLGAVEAQTFATLHGRHPSDRLRFTTRVREGRRAVTHVEVVQRFGKLATHVRCRLETGRTHQIRVHLAEAGHAILGDALYGKPPKDPWLKRVAATLAHQALVARVLGFVHPRTGETMRFEVGLPPEMVAALRDLSAISKAQGGGV